MLTMATATMPLTSPGPSAAMMAMARRKYGKAIRMSMPRMIARSTQRPTKPGSGPAQRAGQGAQGRRAQPEGERDPGAVEEPAQEVSAELVGAQHMPGGQRRGEPARRVDGVRVVGGDERRDHRGDDHRR